MVAWTKTYVDHKVSEEEEEEEEGSYTYSLSVGWLLCL
jgi:hypothetical protein